MTPAGVSPPHRGAGSVVRGTADQTNTEGLRDEQTFLQHTSDGEMRDGDGCTEQGCQIGQEICPNLATLALRPGLLPERLRARVSPPPPLLTPLTLGLSSTTSLWVSPLPPPLSGSLRYHHLSLGLSSDLFVGCIQRGAGEEAAFSVQISTD